ncbi:MAG: DUF4124 domain-containing protein [Pseudomonadota bacterium]
MRLRPLPTLVLLMLSLPALAAEKEPKIFKCQDAQGRTHYGSTAASECARSKVIEMSDQGTARREIAAPPTEAELKDREARRGDEERQKQDSDDRARKDKILLATYPNVEELEQFRTRKLTEMENAIQASETTLQSLRRSLERLEGEVAEEKKAGKPNAKTSKALEQARKQVERHDEQIAKRRQDMENMRKQYDADVARYRELRKVAPPRASGR